MKVVSELFEDVHVALGSLLTIFEVDLLPIGTLEFAAITVGIHVARLHSAGTVDLVAIGVDVLLPLYLQPVESVRRVVPRVFVFRV